MLQDHPHAIHFKHILYFGEGHRMATIPHCGHARNRRALAQGRIPFVLEADLQGQGAGRETTDVEGDSGIDLPNGR
jgi:hypothetical protein